MYLNCPIKNQKLGENLCEKILQDRERNYCNRENVLTVRSAGISRIMQKGTLFYRKVWGTGMKD